MRIVLEQLIKIMPNLKQQKAIVYVSFLNDSMEEFQINTPARQAAFLSQLAHESVGLTAFEEFASGKAYEGRHDLGNTQSGDGVRFKGRGPIQLTGRDAYRRAGEYLGLDLENNPKQASDPSVGFRIAGWFWTIEKKLNELADTPDLDHFHKITHKINGGHNGEEQRDMYYKRAKEVLGVK